MPYNNKHRPLQQQPVRQYDAQQQQGGSTEFQPRIRSGPSPVQAGQQMGSGQHLSRPLLRIAQSAG